MQVAWHTPKIDDPDSAKVCYQTDYNDAHYTSIGYVPGFCPFQLVSSQEILTICDHNSGENVKYCPDSEVNITVYKMGKS